MKRCALILAALALAGAGLLAGAGPAAAADLPLIITPNPVTAGGQVTFSGTGCVGHPTDPGSLPPLVFVFEQTSGALVSDPVAPAANGSWSLTIDVPDEVPAGEFTFEAVCDYYSGSVNYGPTTLRVIGSNDGPFMFLPAFVDDWSHKPQLHVSTQYEVDAFGFLPGEPVVLSVHSSPVDLTTFTADENGEIIGRFQLPADTVPGAHELVMTGQFDQLTADLAINVVGSVTPTTATSGPTSTATPVTATTATAAVTHTSASDTTTAETLTLAATGSPASSLTGAGAALTVAGVATLLLARRRRGARDH